MDLLSSFDTRAMQFGKCSANSSVGAVFPTPFEIQMGQSTNWATVQTRRERGDDDEGLQGLNSLLTDTEQDYRS